jgi:hypothetical protein
MGQGREDGSQIIAIGRKRRAGHRETRLPQGCGAIGAQIVIEAPIEHRAAQSGDIGIARAVADRAERGFGSEQFGPDRRALAAGIARHRRWPAPLQQLMRAAAVMVNKSLFFDLRLEREGGGCDRQARTVVELPGRHDTGGDFIGIIIVADRGEREAAAKDDSRRLVPPPLAGPKRRLHAALGGQRMGERACGGGL